jgi:hypothetical protein
LAGVGDAGEFAAGAGAADGVAGVPELSVEGLLSELPTPVPAPPSELPLSLDPAAFGFAFPYPSAYQPPPLKAIAGAEMTRSNGPPQLGQIVISGSENFWIFSVCLWQAVHSYS